MKFGICLPIRLDATARQNVEIAQKVEELGFDSIWVSDHIVMPEKHSGSFSEVFYEPFTLLTYVSAVTSRISIGTSVIILPYRNPVVMAKQIATLDILSEGRVLFGVGPGWMKEEFQALGVPHNKRGKMTDEYILAMRELWINESPEFDGEFCSFSEIKFEPKPFQKPHPPIIIAGSSEFAVKRAASSGDGWQPTWVSPEQVERGMQSIKRIANDQGRDLENFIWSVRNRVNIFSNTEEKESFISGLPDNSPYSLLGTSDEIIDYISNYGNIGVSHIVFDPAGDNVEEVLGIMESLSGIIQDFK